MFKYSIALLPLFLLAGLISHAQTDSLIIKGQVLNLNGRLYRQASSITFSRNNILLPQSELSKRADLQPDGTFRVALPIFYQKEEISLDYGGRASATFLGSKGEVNITFDGDSLGKSKKLFRFGGVNAEANNQFPSFQEAEKKAFESNKVLGDNFYKTFWDKDILEAKMDADTRMEWRKQILAKQTSGVLKTPNPALVNWTNSIAEDEKIQNDIEATLSLNQPLVPPIVSSLPNLSSWPLTVQKVTMANRYGEYSDAAFRTYNESHSDKRNSLSVKTMADMFLDHVKPLSPSEREKLMQLSEKGTSNSGDIDFLSTLFARNEKEINILFDFEREKRVYAALFEPSAIDFLTARYLPKNFFRFSYQNQLLLSNHIQKGLENPLYKKSLAELVDLELKDTVNIKKFVSFTDSKNTVVEVLPGYWASYSSAKGDAWLTNVLKSKEGKTVYLVVWNVDDPESRENMDYMASLRAQVPADVEFLYLHAKDEPSANELAKQFVVRHHMEGTHLFLTFDQLFEILTYKIRSSANQVFAIIQPNGKIKTRNAPGPSEPQKLIPLLLEAGK